MAGPPGVLTCTVGTECGSALTELSVRLTSTIATPPARSTSADLATRSTTPRSQTTMRPATAAGSSVFGVHRAASAADAGGRAAFCAATSGNGPTGARTVVDAPT